EEPYFLNSLTSDIDSLVIYAGIHALHFGNFHRLLAKRFPFAVYYRLEDSIIHIYAVLDCRQNPAWLRNQLVHTDAEIVSRPKVTEEQPKKAYKVGSTRLQHGTTPIASHCAWFAETVWGWDTTENLPESSSSAIPAHSAAIPRASQGTGMMHGPWDAHAATPDNYGRNASTIS
ncbi:hypothetical protein, partial [Acidithiobacillus marinus]|uniref:hypothetical protein n=1 Tax=Acidithiobacillus marinus TaxID=187490 RepID=UPI0015576FEF